MNKHILSLYRSYLRQVRSLPHVYLRHFFRIKGGDDFRSVLKTSPIKLRRAKLKRISNDLQRLRAANSGRSIAFDHILDMAYGRVGKLLWELAEPLVSDPNAPSPPLADPTREEKTYSPAYSALLSTLLTSGISRTTRPLQKHHLVSPPGLPGRAKTDSEDALLLGPLSKRREFNIRWRFFRSEWKKVLPPLQVSPEHAPNHIDTCVPGHSLNFGFHNTCILQELILLAGSPSSSPDLPGKQKGLHSVQQTHDMSHFDGDLPVRWLRRRYQALLGRVPLLIPRYLQRSTSIVYDVRLAENAISTSKPHSPRLRVVGAKDILWIRDIQVTAPSEKR